MNIQINREFKALIPPLSPKEYRQLEQNIIADGCREPLVVFNNTLVDGHNRYEICTRHDLPFKTVAIDFADGLAAKLWMIDNQSGRRNLTDGWKYQLSQAKKQMLLEIGKKSQGARTDILSIIDKKLPAHNTRETIANDLGWSTGKVAMADKVWKDASPEIKGQVLSGEVSINEAYIAVKAGDTHVGKNSGENEWYTPELFIDAARSVMGTIDLDPASSERANKTVKAAVIYTIEDNGLTKDWSGNVWLNPPYAQPLMNQFAEKLVNEIPNLTHAIVLVNNATETKWFQSMAKVATAFCFPETRIKFIDKQGMEGAPLQGQTFLYFGAMPELFVRHFSQFGFVMPKPSFTSCR